MGGRVAMDLALTNLDKFAGLGVLDISPVKYDINKYQ
jgi:pimeloyl-ACP methyl ester carboxylesterase